MRRSIASEMPANDTPFHLEDRHYIYDLIDTLTSFFRNYFENSVKVVSLVEHPLYVTFDGAKFSEFINYALSLNKNGGIMNIYLRELDGMLNLLIGTCDTLKITADEEKELHRLAGEIGFDVNLRDNAIIAYKKAEIIKAVPLRATDVPNTLFEQLCFAFFGDNEG